MIGIRNESADALAAVDLESVGGLEPNGILCVFDGITGEPGGGSGENVIAVGLDGNEWVFRTNQAWMMGGKRGN